MGGASAVPAGGFALRSRAASGHQSPGTTTGAGGAPLGWDRRRRVTPVRPRPRKPGLKLSLRDETPFGESRGGTPTGGRAALSPRRARLGAVVAQRLSAFRFLLSWLAWLWRDGRSEKRNEAPPLALSFQAGFALHVAAFTARAQNRAAKTGELGHGPLQRRRRRVLRHAEGGVQAQAESQSGGIRAASRARKTVAATALLRGVRAVEELRGVRQCRRQQSCRGDASVCLKRALDRMPHNVQRRARQDIIAAMPPNLGAPEREARLCMPADLYE